MNIQNNSKAAQGASRLFACALAASLLVASPLRAAQTDISSTPITATNSAQVKPNIMLLMDTSDSMRFSHMPDEVEPAIGPGPLITDYARVGYESPQCNILYYNPTKDYILPKRADGSFFLPPSFAAAPYDAFDTLSVTTVDLSVAFKAYDSGFQGQGTLRGTGYDDSPQEAYYYIHTGGTNITSYASPACADATTNTPTQPASDGGTWTRYRPTTAAEQQHFAIWYSYYRLRINMIKSAASLAFAPLTDSMRVGFITINPKYPFNVPLASDYLNAPINPDKYLKIADFDTPQRGAWYDKLFSQKTGGTSPAREGLARVGRHYAGKTDGINTGMPEDPIQYSCQQNFTIMTTDGYWNDQAETPGAGPVRIDGTTPVGQQDAVIDAYTTNTATAPDTVTNFLSSPRPIWEGVPNGKTVRTDKKNAYQYAPCGVYFNRTDTQVSVATTQTLISTSQTTQSTAQYLQSTSQVLKTSLQNLQSTTQMAQSTAQNLQSTNQNLQSTNQNLRSRTQTLESTSQARQSTVQNLRSTSQMVQNTSQTTDMRTWVEESKQINRRSTTQTRRSTSQSVRSTSQSRIQTTQNRQSTTQTRASTLQNLQSTVQTTQRTLQNLQNTVQNLTSTSQARRSTLQTIQSTLQTLTSTYQELKSTSQVTLTTSQVRQSTSQDRYCPDSGETCAPVATNGCVPGNGFHCEKITTGPTLVASCTAADGTQSSNNYVLVTCATTGSSSPVLSCTPAMPNAGNAFTTTTCNTAVTTLVPVDTCNSSGANIGNAFTVTTCSNSATGPTPSNGCTPIAGIAGNSYVNTTCTSSTTGPSGVDPATCPASVAASALNSWTATTCTTNVTTNVPVASCVASPANAGNSWLDTTCNSVVTTNVPSLTCSVSAAAAGNSWTATTCSNGNTTNVAVSSCTPSAANAGNLWTATTCPAPATTGPFGVDVCTGVAASGLNSWTATICGTNNTTSVPVATCTAAVRGAGNNWTDTTCGTNTSGPTGVQNCVVTAAAFANNWTATSCAPNNTTNVAVGTCTAAAPSALNFWTLTTCPAAVVVGPNAVDPALCTAAAASALNSWTTTTCPPLVANNTPSGTCTAGPGTAINNWVTTTCPAPLLTGPTGVQICNPSAGIAPNWITTTCAPNNTTNVAVGTCTAALAAGANLWTATTCPAPTITQAPVAVQTCTAAVGTIVNGWESTICTNRSSTIPSGVCVPSGPTALNGWVTTVCNVLTGNSIPVQTCTPQTGSALNNWITITCPGPIVNNNVPVLTCTGSVATAPLWTTTTCPPPVVTTNVPVASCTAALPIGLNNFVRTTCPAPITTGPAGVQTCVAAPPGIGNNYVATTCTPNNNLNQAVFSCAVLPANAGNQWVDTTCPAAIVTTDVPVATCSAGPATLANGWVSTTCPAAVVTSNVPVSSCAPAAAVAGNNFTSFTCPAPITTGNSTNWVATCAASPATALNSWTATICYPNNTTNVAVAACVSDPVANVGNNWKATVCSSNDSYDVPSQTCVNSGPTALNGYTTVSCTPVITTDVPVQNCSASNPGTAANFWVATTCTPNVANNVPVSSCTPILATALNGWVTTTCPVLLSGPSGTNSCTNSGPTPGNNYLTTTCSTDNTGPIPVAACTPIPATAANSWKVTTCPTIITGPAFAATCTPANASIGNDFTRTQCDQTAGSKIQYVQTKTTETTFFSGSTQTSYAIVTDPPSALTDLDGVCYAPNVAAAPLPTPNPGEANWTGADTTAYPSCSAWPCSESSAPGLSQSVNSLADVAQYYYITDLRHQNDWPPDKAFNDVPSVGTGKEDDQARWQHMTTFSIALGVSGTLNFKSRYKTAATGDFDDIRCEKPPLGTHAADESDCKNWPLWPDPALDYTNKNNWNNPKGIDDFWHTAVNGRGVFFSAADPSSVIDGMADALAGISARLASGSGAATSNLEPVSGDRMIYLASYTTQKWTGDVQAKQIDLATGAIDPALIWSAQALLNGRTSAACDTRNIYLFRQGATNNLADFTWNTSVCDGGGNPAAVLTDGLTAAEQAHFGALNVSLLSQYPDMTDGTLSADQRTPAAGSNLLNFIRGQRGLENFVTNDASKLYRGRAHVLGDIVNGQPTYVRAPFSLYGDSGYAVFKSTYATRTPMLYVPGNDGMLHAFYAGVNETDVLGGKEAWAMIPSSVLPRLWKLADHNYANLHNYYVDGTPSVSDIYDTVSATWKTILVGGLNGGGKGYYALDVTDPLAPKGLWEFNWDSAVCPSTSGASVVVAATGNSSDCHLGYTFGKPLISKLADGTWVVMVTSGYNNVNTPPQTGDGVGYLYVLDAATGKIIYKIATGVGDGTTPSGLAQINNFVELSEINNLTVRVYGTDLLGNIWR
ncbi:MAG: PilC/PilY family type IV pilus protein, partial [Caldimonas sp.]